jgi:hypothetical protein
MGLGTCATTPLINNTLFSNDLNPTLPSEKARREAGNDAMLLLS